ncbi:MAG: copper chaperone PCu(A)C [Pseudomonadota bacterium]
MSLKTLLCAASASALLTLPALAGGITIEDPYARASTPTSPSGAAFMTIVNAADVDDRLVAATSGVAQRVEIHTHIEDANGIMRMVEVKDGIAVPAQGKAMLMRGGDHVMFMGLTQPLLDGETVEVTLTFEQAGDVTVEIPVDLQRRPEGHSGHAGHDHGAHKSN